MSATFRLLRPFLSPDLSPDYLAALVAPLVETLALVIAAMTLVFALSLPLAVAASLGGRGAALLVRGLTVLRAIPDLTLAIFCVVIFGLGPGAALIALVLYYTAAVTKMFAELFETAPRGPLDALRASGAGRFQVALYGLLPLTAPDLFGYGAFAFECALRSAVIVGAVGGGGIGAELVGSLAGLDFARASTLILVMIVTIALLDRVAVWLSPRPRLLLAFVPVGLAAAWHLAPATFAWRHGLGVLGEMVPPRLDADSLAALPRLLWQTLWVATAGTLGAALAGLLLALVAARNVSPAWLVWPTRRLLELLRTVPEVVWGLVLVATAGVGPVAGAWALGLHSAGSLGRLFADSIDALPEGPRRALASTGASPIAVAAYADLPLAAPQLATHVLFRFDWNLRMATVLGLIGAGGVGQALYEAQQLFFYDRVLAWVLVIAALILSADWLSGRLRARLAGFAGRAGAARAAGLPSVMETMPR